MQQKNIEVKIPIPHCYKWMSNGNKRLYTNYVRGYLKGNFPDHAPLRIEAGFAICEIKPKRKGG